MGLADLHIHTTHSVDGTCTVQAILKHASSFTDISVLAITDHDEISGALEAEQIAPAYGIEVIPGCEISTADGHLLALFLRQRIPSGLSLVETVRRVGEAGGICVAPHPGARGSHSLSLLAVYRALQAPEVAQVLVGIEGFNAGQLDQRSGRAVRVLANNLSTALVSSSDAHLLWMVGLAATYFEGSSASDVRRALETGATEMIWFRRASAARLIGGFLSGYILRKAGWVTGTLSPEGPVFLGRAAGFASLNLQ